MRADGEGDPVTVRRLGQCAVRTSGDERDGDDSVKRDAEEAEKSSATPGHRVTIETALASHHPATVPSLARTRPQRVASGTLSEFRAEWVTDVRMIDSATQSR